MNEFYSVVFSDGDEFFFKTKDKAFAYLHQEFLNSLSGDEDEEYIQEQLYDLNEFWAISNLGEIHVNGFED